MRRERVEELQWIGGMRLIYLSFVLAASACGGTETKPTANIVRDSAGVRIVESAAPSWSTGTEWRIEDEPEISFGLAPDELTVTGAAHPK